MLSRHNGGIQLLISSLNCLLECFGPHTSLPLLLPVTCLAHLPPSSFALHLTPTSHCASVTCPSKYSLSCFGPLSRSVILVCTPWAAAVSSRSHSNLLTAKSYQNVFCLPLVLLFLHGFLGSDPGCLFFVLHIRLIRVLLLTSWLTRCTVSSFSRSPAAIGSLFLAPRHALQTFSFVPILGFGSRVSLALVCFFSPDCDFMFVIVLVASLSCATSRLVSSSSSILW